MDILAFVILILFAAVLGLCVVLSLVKLVIRLIWLIVAGIIQLCMLPFKHRTAH